MPRNTRQWARRKFDMATNLIDTAGQHVYEIQQVYQEAHPDIAKALQVALESFAATMQHLDHIKATL